MIDVWRVIDWNERAGNPRWEIDRKLETDMLYEEWEEFRTAMIIDSARYPQWLEWFEKKDVIANRLEAIDWLLDIIYVSIWTLHKLGLDAEQITNAFNAVCDSNDTKLPFVKNVDGKIQKSGRFVRPALAKAIGISKV